MTKDEALKLALEALETSMYPQQKQLQAITAIKEALMSVPDGAQPEQPAQQQEQGRQIDQLIKERDHRDEIIDKLCDAVLGPDRYEWSSQYFFEDAVREVEERMAALEQPAQQQEPFIYYRFYDDGTQDYPDEKTIPLYTSPPASKPWVGLTDEDIKEAEWLLSAIKEHEAYTLQEQLLVEGVDVFARAIEAKLKEKNT